MQKELPHSVESLLYSLSKKGASKSKIGIRLFADKSSGYITRPDGKKRYFRYTLNDINSAGATAIAKHKHLTKQALMDFSINVPEGVSINILGDKQNIKKVCKSFIKKYKFPIVVKPASLSKGEGVSIVRNQEDLFIAVKKVSRIDNIIILEKYIEGTDYRIVVLNNKIVCAYSKHPIGPYKPANLSLGGIAKDATTLIHRDFTKIALKISRELNLAFCGIDIIIKGDVTLPENGNYCVLEVNSAPDNSYYAKLGKKQNTIITEMYDKIFDCLINKIQA